MSELDRETLSEVVQVARDHGFRHVRLRSGKQSFEADLAGWDGPLETESSGEVEPEPQGQHDGERRLTAPVVGYYRQPASPLTVGSLVKPGQVVGEVVALGIANEIVAEVEGEVTEVLVEDGAALEYGQLLAKVKLS